MYRRSDAVAWGVYLYRLTQNPVPHDIATEIVSSGDCMGMAALLAVREHEDLVESFVESLDVSYQYRLDQYWILIHELDRLGRIAPGDRLAAYVNSTGLEQLRQENVSFLVEPRSRMVDVDEAIDGIDF
ncbi:MAG: hypothetical protein IPF79_09125 [Ignavibacteria bacterium]|nr:hypothetical protein [Ignavibacteria bacterium]